MGRGNPIRTMVRLSLVAALALGMTACGRRGPPEAPPGARVITTDEQGNPVEGTADTGRPFILDPLLQ